MKHHLAQNLWGKRHNLGSDLSSFDYMKRVSNACHKHVSVKFVIPKNLNYFSNKAHSVLTCIIKSADKGADIRCTRFGRQNSLICRKHKCDVSFYTFLL